MIENPRRVCLLSGRCYIVERQLSCWDVEWGEIRAFFDSPESHSLHEAVEKNFFCL